MHSCTTCKLTCGAWCPHSCHECFAYVLVQVLKKLAADSIKANEAVWFGCDVGQHCSWAKHGVEDLRLYDYELVFGLRVDGMTKAQRLLYRDSLMTHAMVLTAVSEDVSFIQN